MFSSRKRSSTAVLAAIILGLLVIPSIGQAERKFFPASENGVPGRYGVALMLGQTASAAPELVWSVGGRLGYIYRHIFNGFEADLTEYQAERLSRHPWVKNVVQERYLDDPLSYTLPHCYVDFDTNTRTLPPLPAPGDPVPQQSLDCADPAPGGDCIDNWGIDRIDQYGLPRDAQFSYRQPAGSVKVYVIDTGIFATNREFNDASGNSRVATGIDAICTNFPFCPPGNVPCSGTWSGKGHGTHVAAILGGRTFGLARDVEIVPIKALCVTYTTEEIKKAFEYLLFLHSPSAPTAVVNLSGVNGQTSCDYDPNDPNCDHQLLDAVISVASRDNVLLVQSAGNQSGSDACDRTFGDEARYSNPPDAAAIARIVIAAGSDANDGRWRSVSGDYGHPIGSNIGGCVDIFAPAAYVDSAFYPVDPGSSDPDEIVCQLSGTSMAAPHVSGVAAMILNDYPDLTADQLRTFILNWADRDVLESNPSDPNYIGNGSPNLLLHWDPSDLLRDGFETGDARLWVVSP